MDIILPEGTLHRLLFQIVFFFEDPHQKCEEIDQKDDTLHLIWIMALTTALV